MSALPLQPRRAPRPPGLPPDQPDRGFARRWSLASSSLLWLAVRATSRIRTHGRLRSFTVTFSLLDTGLRIFAMPSGGGFAFGPYQLDMQSQRLKQGGAPV